MAQLDASFGPYGAFAGATSGAHPYANPFADTTKSYDRNLFEDQEGAPALGYYATQSGANQPFSSWLTSYGTHRQLWSDYLGQFAAKNDPSYAFTDYLRENDPYKLYASLSPQDRGETPTAALAPFVQFMGL